MNYTRKNKYIGRQYVNNECTKYCQLYSAHFTSG